MHVFYKILHILNLNKQANISRYEQLHSLIMSSRWLDDFAQLMIKNKMFNRYQISGKVFTHSCRFLLSS